MVVAGEKALQKRLAAGAMAAGGAVQSFGSVDEAGGRIEFDLALVEFAPRIAADALTPPGPAVMPPAVASLAARLPEGARLIPILPAPDLAWMTALLANPRVPCVLVGDYLTASQVTATVAKLLARDLFGVDKVLPWGVRVYSALVSDYNEKSAAIAAIGDFAQAMGVRRKYREQIDQCIDEMLMNALYDAPVDADGKPLFADIPVRDARPHARRRKGARAIRLRRRPLRRQRPRRLRHPAQRDRPPLPRQVPARRQEPARSDRSQGERRRPRALPHLQLGLRRQLPRLRRLGDRGGLQLRSRGAARAAALARRLRGADRRRALDLAGDHDPVAARPPSRRSGAAVATAAPERALARDDDLRRVAAALRRRPGRAALSAPTDGRVAAHRDRSAGRARLRRRPRARLLAARGRRRSRPLATRCAPSAPASTTTSSWSPPPRATRRCACTSSASPPRSPSRPSRPARAYSSTARRPAS